VACSVKLYVRFLRFFKIQKKHDLLRFFELLHTFSRTLERMTIGNRVFEIDVFEGVGQFGPKFQVEREVSHQPFFASQN